MVEHSLDSEEGYEGSTCGSLDGEDKEEWPYLYFRQLQGEFPDITFIFDLAFRGVAGGCDGYGWFYTITRNGERFYNTSGWKEIDSYERLWSWTHSQKCKKDKTKENQTMEEGFWEDIRNRGGYGWDHYLKMRQKEKIPALFAKHPFHRDWDSPEASVFGGWVWSEIIDDRLKVDKLKVFADESRRWGEWALEQVPEALREQVREVLDNNEQTEEQNYE
jgi:hypothetical protein